MLGLERPALPPRVSRAVDELVEAGTLFPLALHPEAEEAEVGDEQDAPPQASPPSSQAEVLLAQSPLDEVEDEAADEDERQEWREAPQNQHGSLLEAQLAGETAQEFYLRLSSKVASKIYEAKRQRGGEGGDRERFNAVTAEGKTYKERVSALSPPPSFFALTHPPTSHSASAA